MMVELKVVESVDLMEYVKVVLTVDGSDVDSVDWMGG